MRWRLLAAFAWLVAGVLLTQDIPLASQLRDIERVRLNASIERDAFMIAGEAIKLLQVVDQNPDEHDADEVQEQARLTATAKLYAEQKQYTVVVVDADGRLIVSTSPETLGTVFANPNRPEIAQALAGNPVTGDRYSETAKETLSYVAVPVRSGAATIGAVRITASQKTIDRQTLHTAGGLLLVFLISLLGAGIAAVLLANWIRRPVSRLQRSTEAFAAGDLGQEAAVDEGPPEVRALARSFNAMTGRISGLMQQQRSFTGDASHQLRTPLTALRLQLERAAAMVDDNPEGARERIEAASLETERLQRLVEGLLMIARSEGTQHALAEVDVTSIVRERVEVWEPFASERGVQLLTSTPDGVRVKAVPNALEQIIDNYVDNALGVVTDGGTITVAVTVEPQSVSVHVVDDGPGMQPDHLAHAFDRFWRAPDARQGGSGIGLAVVQQLAKISGGQAELRNRRDRTGLDASVVFPKT